MQVGTFDPYAGTLALDPAACARALAEVAPRASVAEVPDPVVLTVTHVDADHVEADVTSGDPARILIGDRMIVDPDADEDGVDTDRN